MLKEIANDIWVVDQPQRFMGLEVGAKMTVIRLAQGGLFLHSPIELNGELKRELDALGPVKYAVAPNCYHHLYVGKVLDHYPGAKIFVAPKLKEKRPDLGFATTLEDGREYPFSQEISHLVCDGMPTLNEVLFLHKASGTALLTDIAFNIGKDNAPSARIFAKATGIYERLAMSRFDKLLFIRNHKAAKKSFARLFEWDFDRVVVAHGSVVLSGGKELLRQGLPQ